jgi:hypothetical protein
MPPEPASPERLLALGAALGPLRECAREGAEEVLGHVPEAGDRPTQSAVDGFLDVVADLLRGIEASAADLADRFRVAALSAESTERDLVQRIEERSITGQEPRW